MLEAAGGGEQGVADALLCEMFQHDVDGSCVQGSIWASLSGYRGIHYGEPGHGVEGMTHLGLVWLA